MTDMKIEVGKKYRTRQGEIVLIEQEGHPSPGGAPSEFYQFSGWHTGSLESWRADGRYSWCSASSLDLVEEIDEGQAESGKFDPNAALAQALGPGAPIHYPANCMVTLAEDGSRQHVPVTPADIAAITAIHQAMRHLTASETSAVVAWFGAHYL